MLYSAIVSPFSFAFLDLTISDPLYRIEIIIDVFFMIDLLINLNLGYYDEDGHLVEKRFLIVKNYFFTWFLLDFISSVPFSIIESVSNSHFIGHIGAMPRLLRVMRVLKIIKNFSQLENIDFFISTNQRTKRLLKVIFGIFLSLHIVSCLWFFSARILNFSEYTWVFRLNYLDAATKDQYLTSLYWAITTLTTVGYGDVVPMNYLEKIIAMS